MENKEIVKMIQSGEYNHLTVSEFANMVNNHKEEVKEFDVDKWAIEAEDIIHRIFEPDNELAWLNLSFKPTSVTVYKNH